MKIRDHEIPGYPEAVKRENDIRDAAFLDLTTDICGIKIRQMTPRDLLILDGTDNPLVCHGIPSSPQLAHFLWLLSGSYCNNAPIRRFIFARKVRPLPFMQTVKACWKYVEETFQDSPGGSGPQATPFAGWCAHLIDRTAFNYGWTRGEILNTPLQILFQCQKVIRARKDAEYTPRNPSDKIRGEGAIALFKARTELLSVLKRRAN
jgi:hypothetical protein